MADFITPSFFENVPQALKLISTQQENYWHKLAMHNASTLFSKMYEKIPAYRRFLQSHNCNVEKIVSEDDFLNLPIITKKEYLQKYSYEELLFDKPEKVKSFYMSSGSTGEPTIWPRLPEADLSYSIMVNFFYTAFWKIDQKKTLYISAMDLGIWASGNLQFHAAMYCAKRHNFTFANPGADYRYIYSIIKQLHKYYDQIIIATYPSVARRLLDYLLEKKELDIAALDIHFMLGGEPHTIEWRQYLLEKLKISPDDISHVLDYYGTSDSGGPGTSTPLTEIIQNLCQKDKDLCKSLFGQVVVPSLFQKNPFLHVESIDSRIIVTYPGQLPLCRYDSGDTGGMLSFERVMGILNNHGYNIKTLLERNSYGAEYIWTWPFIYLTGRNDQAISVGGAVVYPKDIEGLFFQEKTKYIKSFKLSVEYDSDKNQQFTVYLELKPQITLNAKKIEKMSMKYYQVIVDRLIEVNEDYAGAYRMDKHACAPRIRIVQYSEYPFNEDIERHKPVFVKKN